jgi:subtilisin family serine protease
MQSQFKFLKVAGLAALVACTLSPAAVSAQAGPPQDRYIVVLNAGAGIPADVAADVALRTNGRVGYVYETVLNGFSITMPRAALAGLRLDPRVAYVEEDIPVTAFAQTVPTGVQRIFADAAALGIDGVDDQRVDVDVAVLDTGIDRQHPDLNVVGGANCMNTTGGGPPWARTYFCDDSEDGDDDHYHGTHVAGTIGALDNGIGVVGVAPGARLWAVKVLDSQGSGALAGIIAGIDWVAAHPGIARPAVINMSLGGSGTSTAMNDAIANAVQQDVAVVVAAGNSDADAANFTPANAPDAITVSALADFDGAAGGAGSPTCRTDQDDTLADFSNWGATVEIAAPGVCILSTFPIERGEYGTISGTSMASPHVAGAAALLASNGVLPADIRDKLLHGGNSDWADDSGDNVKEPLLEISDTNVFTPTLVATGGGGGGDTNNPPLASFDFVCTELSCNFSDTSTDGDGSVVAWSWNFGDGNSSSVRNSGHLYASGGTYTVTLTVTDDDGASDDVTQSVTVVSGDGRTLTGSSVNNGSSWTAMVTTSDESSLSGTWSYSGGSANCAGDTCSLSGIAKRQSSVTFTSSLGESVIVAKP